ncbi:MAG: DUF3987 domain-containing protein, partial [Halothiobacillaceae bacterium]|nr:DUF3987 domain-containing protein [Halothiobacillaceae bacterium]
ARDIVSTIKYLDGLSSQTEAARRLLSWMGTAPPEPEPTRTKTAPKPMKTRPTRHPALGEPSMTWEYRGADGALMAVICRFETDTGKEFRPLTPTPDGWYWRAPPEPRPLYGLDRLAARPEAPVLLTEGEKAADAAGILMPDSVTVASMNGARSPGKTDWTPLQGRRLLIWPDADGPGADYASTAARLALEAGAQSVAILDLSSLAADLPEGYDADDALHEGMTALAFGDIARWSEVTPGAGASGAKGEKARGTRDRDENARGESGAHKGAFGANPDANVKVEALRVARLALALDRSTDVEYPLDALGPFANTARALADGAQIRPAMAGQSLLAVAAVLAQSVANVRTIESVKPLSLYLLTVGESGDGKSTGDTVAQTAVQARQRAESRSHLEALRELESAPREKGAPKAEPPREPYRIARDGTVEGIRRGFAQGVPSQGVLTSEAAAMLSGYGMTQDNRAKTAATLNALWDDGELSVSRGTTGRVQLYDRRLSVHWLIQPDAVHDVMADPLLSGIGFWPRFLVAWPEPSAPRTAKPWRADRDGDIADFWRACNRLMDRPLGEDCSDLPVLEPTAEAMSLACQFFERMEQAAKGRRGALRDIKPFAVRATEQALRIAGVLTVLSDQETVDAGAMRHGIALAAYALETWRGVFGDRDANTAKALAMRLFRWMLDQPGVTASEGAINRIGPKAVRPRDRRDTALAMLEQARLAYRSGSTWTLEVG